MFDFVYVEIVLFENKKNRIELRIKVGKYRCNSRCDIERMSDLYYKILVD